MPLVWGLSANAVTFQYLHSFSQHLLVLTGAFLGCLAGWLLAKSRWTNKAVGLTSLLGYGISVLICELARQSQVMATALSPDLAFTFYQPLELGLGAFFLIACCRCLTLRWEFIIPELLLVGFCFLYPLSDHRFGFINYPHFFVDPLWQHGLDPISCLTAVGTIATILMILLNAGIFNRRNIALDLSILLLIALLIGIFLPVNEVNKLLPQQRSGQNSTSDKESGKGKSEQDGKKDQDDQDQQGNQGLDDKDDKNNSSSNNDAPLAVVVFYNDYNPQDVYYYFRQSALSLFNGNKLIEDLSPNGDTDIAQGFPSSQLPRGGVVPVMKDGADTKQVRTRVCLLAEHSRPFALTSPLSFTQIANPNPAQFVMTYECLSLVPTASVYADPAQAQRLQVGSPQWSPERWQHYTELPDDPRYAQLAQEIVEVIPWDYRECRFLQVVALKMWLEKNGTYDLKAKTKDSQEKDAVAQFLFGSQTGYCVHFANAMTYLCRSLDIPARVGTGYVVDSRLRYDGSALLISGENSHAWCEVYLDGRGWTVIDIAPENVASMLTPNQPDADLQHKLGEMARQDKELQKKDQQVQQEARDIRVDIQRLLGYGAGFLITVILAACYGIKIWRRLAPLLCSRASYPDKLLFSALDKLSEAGYSRKYGETREAFAQRCRDKFPSLETLTRAQVANNLGNPDNFQVPSSAELRRAFFSLHKEIFKATSLIRLLLGIFNPFSWIGIK